MGAADKIKAEDELCGLLSELKSAGKKVVWTNGCFDIIHRGHVSYLEQAAQFGNLLVVGLNSDSSVRSVKGPDRPVNCQDDRAKALGALSCVDYVVIFDYPTTVRLLELLKPDVYAKGGDYTIDTINQDERKVVEGYGGTIEILPEVKGVSTTQIIERIREQS